jgi:hypothetical protein
MLLTLFLLALLQLPLSLLARQLLLTMPHPKCPCQQGVRSSPQRCAYKKTGSRKHRRAAQGGLSC